MTPERASNEARLVGSTVTTFVTREVLPALDRLEQHDWETARRLVERCGALGLLGIDACAADGGTAAGTTVAIAASDRMALAASFRTTVAVQTNLVILPLTLFGTTAQRDAYMSSLLSGQMVGAFALTESGAGSDAFSAETSAEARADGSFVLRGQKQWITNGSLADLFIVFAQVPAHGLTAFLVDRTSLGVGVGREERKMGLHGSSTTAVILNEVVVSGDRVLGPIGRGRDIARTALNYARLKLGAMCVGDAKNALREACRYASLRRQFGRAIASFGAVAHKLGEMVVRTYAVESIVWRTAGRIDLARADGESRDAFRSAIDASAVEASMAKVAGSETLEWIAAEAIQVLGANGYSQDFQAERRYRDARPNRIFEGTNEINRLFLAASLMKHGMRTIGDGGTSSIDEVDGAAVPTALLPALRIAQRVEAAARAIFAQARQARPDGLDDDQEALLLIADVAIDAYGVQSVVLRACAAERPGADDAQLSLHVAVALVFAQEALARIRVAGRTVAASLSSGHPLDTACAQLDRLTDIEPIDAVRLRRGLAAAAIERPGYPLEY